MPSAGSLIRLITIGAQSKSHDAYGQPNDGWFPIITTWASIASASGKQVYAVSGFVSNLSHVITIRYTRTAILPNMQVRYGARSFIVQAVANPNEANVALELMCLELI